VLVDAAALWVHVDKETLQPSRVPEDVVELLTTSSGGRSVGARLLLRQKDFAANATIVPSPWVLRFSDFDAVGHMNNAAYWEMVEEHLALYRDLRAPLRGVVEHVVQVEEGQNAVRLSAAHGSELDLQLVVDETVHAAMWCGTLI
jgi:acyl-ACP thioesterase